MKENTYQHFLRNIMIPQRLITLAALAVFIFCSCSNQSRKNSRESNTPSGKLIVLHAGSLSIPMKEIAMAFEKEYPEVDVLLEAAGSVECARKITELQKECDVFASADYTVIDKLLIPDFADWNIRFASNEMVVAYTGESRKNKEINEKNWYQILLDESVQIGRSDPNADPCGYRTILVMKLAEKFYRQQGLSDRLKTKDVSNIRPKETDLISLLETGNVDYIFVYRSLAEQHKLKYIQLPDEVNLKRPEYSDLYSTVSVEINGNTPSEKIIQKGIPMVYGVTIPKNSPNRVAALAFLDFMLSKNRGMAILEKLGQPSVIPSSTGSYRNIPDELKKYAKQQK